MKSNTTIITGRSTGMNALRERLSKLNKLATEKKLRFGWENMGSHYELFIEDESRKKIFEETVLTSGIPTVKKINQFHDIIEEELKKR